MGVHHLSLVVLNEIRVRAVEDARAAKGERRSMLICVHAKPGSLHAIQLNILILHKLVEEPHRIGSAPDAGNEHVGFSSPLLHALPPRLLPNHGMEVPDHHGKRVGPCDRAEDVVRVLHIGDPVADGLRRGVLERGGARVDRADLCAEEAHAEHVEGLPLHVLCAHVDDALEPEASADGRRGYAVLPCAGLRDDPLLSHAEAQQRLPEGVVDLVGAGVVEVLALEVDLRPRAVGPCVVL
mmetsp:Transcript_24392/g.58134  ORF Transcript_24392/g.58134 Transcript_24392/m.58134 type:complete len:239 (-) Transcript_24392:481-1197(-)